MKYWTLLLAAVLEITTGIRISNGKCDKDNYVTNNQYDLLPNMFIMWFTLTSHLNWAKIKGLKSVLEIKGFYYVYTSPCIVADSVLHY